MIEEREKPCPKCKSVNTYILHTTVYSCPECGNEWDSAKITEDENQSDELIVKDMNGDILQNGDTVLFMKDMPVKGSPKPIKTGTKIKNIRLTNGDHNISCNIPGFGAMEIKSELVKKVNL
jgi:protein PhnA